VRNNGVGSWIARRAGLTPDRAAVFYGDDRLSYAQLHDRVTRLAHGLRGLGVRRGDRVAYLGPNHPAFLETLFAAGTLGAILVPLNTRLAAPELARHLAGSDSRTLIYGAGQDGVLAGLRSSAPVRGVVAVGEPAEGEASYAGLLAAAPGTDIDEAVGLDDPCLIMYTSGTTGRAKGATLSHLAGRGGERAAGTPGRGGLRRDRRAGRPVGRGRPGRGGAAPRDAGAEADLLGFLDGKIARFKIPKSVRFTGTLPRTGTGKILKKRLRETHGDG